MSNSFNTLVKEVEAEAKAAGPAAEALLHRERVAAEAAALEETQKRKRQMEDEQ